MGAAAERLVDVLTGEGVDPSAAQAVAADLEVRYAEPQRAYHTDRHVAEMLTALDELGDEVPPAVVCAVWWHDAVYDPAAGDNERRSAELAEATLTGLGADRALVEETVRLVLVTEAHRAEPGDRAGMLLCDADLAVLAADPARYDAYAAAVRVEYAAVPDEAFRSGRAAVLRSLSAGPWVYATEAGRRRWEQRARANLARELRALG